MKKRKTIARPKKIVLKRRPKSESPDARRQKAVYWDIEVLEAMEKLALEKKRSFSDFTMEVLKKHVKKVAPKLIKSDK